MKLSNFNIYSFLNVNQNVSGQPISSKRHIEQQIETEDVDVKKLETYCTNERERKKNIFFSVQMQIHVKRVFSKK